MTTTATRAQIGAHGEDLAVRSLRARGYEILDRNWRCRFGEVDVIAVEHETLVFIEVKTRTGKGFGTPAESVTATKLRRIRRLAGIWLTQQPVSWPHIRIDVIEVRLGQGSPLITQLTGVS